MSPPLGAAPEEPPPPLVDEQPIAVEALGGEGEPPLPPIDEKPIAEKPASPAGEPPPPRIDETPIRVEEGEILSAAGAVSTLFHDDFEAGDPGYIEAAPALLPPTEARVTVSLTVVVEVKVGPIQVSVRGGPDAGRR
ncbi:MAG: hypothetical protein ABI193_01335 [Minicystis sp.]